MIGISNHEVLRRQEAAKPYLWRQRACAGVAVSVLALGAAACSSGSSTSAPKKAKSTSVSGATVTLTTWQSARTNGFIAAALKPLEKRDHITVKISTIPQSDYYVKLDTLSTARKLPDLFWVGNGTEQLWASEHLLYNWTSKATATHTTSFNLSKYAAGAVSGWKAKGELFGLPSLLNTYGVFYNETDLKKAGLSVPSTTWTYTNLYHDAAVLTKADHTYGLQDSASLLTSPFGVSMYSVSHGGKPFLNRTVDPTSLYVGSQFVRGVNLLRTAIKNHWSPPPSYPTTNLLTDFGSGKVPMMFGGQWLAATLLQDKPGFKWGFAPIPMKNNVAPYDAVGIASPSYVPNPTATWKVLSYLDSTAWDSVLRQRPVAPPAYVPASAGYLSQLKSQGQASTAATVQAELGASDKLAVKFLAPWSSKANTVVTADWNNILTGSGPVKAAVDHMVSQIKGVMTSS